MKKTLVKMVLAGAMALSFMSCGKKKVDIGIVLPTNAEPRWSREGENFAALVKDKFAAEIMYSQRSSDLERTNIDSLINKGMKVLIISTPESTAAASAIEEAHKNGVTVICYDRLILNTDAVDYFVTFNFHKVGMAQAQYLLDHTEPGSKGNSLFLYAGAPSDNNAFLIFGGAWEVLQPKIVDGTFIIRNSSKAVALQNKKELTRAEMSEIIDQITTDWDFDVAKKRAADNLTMLKDSEKGVCFVLSPNDGTARSMGDEFAKDSAVTKYYTTGLDAELASLQYIVDGKQSMTVFNDTDTLEKDVLALADRILKGERPVMTAFSDNGKKQVPAQQSAITAIDKDNIQKLIDIDYNGAKTKLQM